MRDPEFASYRAHSAAWRIALWLAAFCLSAGWVVWAVVSAAGEPLSAIGGAMLTISFTRLLSSLRNDDLRRKYG